MLVAVAGAQLQVGLPALVGNREDLPPIVGWAGRARRAQLNMLEYLVLFAILVLVAQIAGKTNAMTLLGCPDLLLGPPRLCDRLCRRRAVAADGNLGRLGDRPLADPAATVTAHGVRARRKCFTSCRW